MKKLLTALFTISLLLVACTSHSKATPDSSDVIIRFVGEADRGNLYKVIDKETGCIILLHTAPYASSMESLGCPNKEDVKE